MPATHFILLWDDEYGTGSSSDRGHRGVRTQVQKMKSTIR
jgi:hypothetical protein